VSVGGDSVDPILSPRMPVTSIPLDAGQHEGIAKQLLPHGVLRAARNMRLARDGTLRPSPGYTALGNLSLGAGNPVTYSEIISFRGRLVALGDVIFGSASDLFEYVEDRDRWRPSIAELSVPLAGARDVRRLASPPHQRDVKSGSVAATSTHVCHVWNDAGDPDIGFVHVFTRAGQTVLQTRLTEDTRRLQVVSTGTSFAIFSSEDVNGATIYRRDFDPSTDTSLGSSGVAWASPQDLNSFAVVSDGANHYTVVRSTQAPAVELGVFELSTNVPVDEIGVSATTTFAVDVSVVWSGSGPGSSIVVTTQPTAGPPAACNVYAYELDGSSFLSLLNGPTALFGGDNCNLHGAFVSPGQTSITYLAAATTLQSGFVRTVFELRSRNTNTLVDTWQWDNTTITARPTPAGLFVGLIRRDGASAADAQILGRSREYLILAQLDAAIAATPFAPTSASGVRSSLVTVGDIAMWLGLTLSGSVESTPHVYSARVSGHARRQVAQFANQLLVSGGALQLYDGRTLTESGWFGAPVILSATSDTGGAMSPGDYFLSALWEWEDSDGNVHLSPASLAFEATVGAGESRLDVVVQGPKSARSRPIPAHANTGSFVTLRIYRTLSATQGVQFLAASVQVPTADFGANVTVNVTQSNAAIQAQGILFPLQGGRIEPVPPLPSRYVAVNQSRALLAGLPDANEFQVSFPAVRGSPVEFADEALLSFFGALDTEITAVASLGQGWVLFTRDALYALTGQGPDLNGFGEFFPPRRLESDGGCLDWRSVVSTSHGVFFQLLGEQIYVLPLDGGSPVWVGQPVRDTLGAHPTVHFAVHNPQDQTVCFGVSNLAGNSHRLLVYDLRREVWTVDELPHVPTSAVAHLGALHVVQNNIVQRQNLAPGVSDVHEYGFETGDVRLFGGAQEWGKVYRIGAVGTVKHACVVTYEVSHDNGVSWQALGAETETGTAGTTFQHMFAPAIFALDRFALRATVVRTGAGHAGPGLDFHEVAFESDKIPHMTRRTR
jgi:hypothetical protein